MLLKKKSVLIACEYSGIVRDAFSNEGWNAMSCDILESESPGFHHTGDVIQVLDKRWDMMIGFPPCTYLSYAGMANWYDEGRAIKRIKAAEFFMKLWGADIQHIAIENPQGIMSQIFRKPDQVIHPYYFGDSQMKRTGLWLKNLPKLQYRLENDLFSVATAMNKPKPLAIQINKKTGTRKKRYFTDYFENNKLKSGHEKSKFFPKVAEAMATQWTDYINSL